MGAMLEILSIVRETSGRGVCLLAKEYVSDSEAHSLPGEYYVIR